MLAPYAFTLPELIRLKIPLGIKYYDSDNTTLILYSKHNVLDTARNAPVPASINWELQFQRHQVSKLLKITG